jgi:hypothetical protein
VLCDSQKDGLGATGFASAFQESFDRRAHWQSQWHPKTKL